MDPDVAEVRVEAGLHETAGVAIERGAASGTDHVADERPFLLLESGTDGGVARRLLQVHHGGRSQYIRAAVHQGFGTG
jgi:hypothetical protein